MSREPCFARKSTAGRSGIPKIDRSIHDSVADTHVFVASLTLGSRLKRRSYNSPVEMLLFLHLNKNRETVPIARHLPVTCNECCKPLFSVMISP
ncbi:hypothetical protein [Alcanivorax jadensis]|uniref:hypothetical protein n=1 Tax=Alcanivorax jadensis TaxID=64988 RepID=UPI00235716AA|nr:hypothetical protein [Alcanivorax jadensis]MDF1637062.1 hypothetical protein [Alcanivorax jadensis]